MEAFPNNGQRYVLDAFDPARGVGERTLDQFLGWFQNLGLTITTIHLDNDLIYTTYEKREELMDKPMTEVIEMVTRENIDPEVTPQLVLQLHCLAPEGEGGDIQGPDVIYRLRQ